MFELDPQRASIVLKPAQFLFEEFALPPKFAPLLFLGAGDANRFEFVPVPIQISRQPHAQFTRIHAIILASTLQRMTHRSSDKRMRTGRHQFTVQRVTKTARLINGMNRVPGPHLRLDPAKQSCAGKALRPLDFTCVTLDRCHGLVQIHIQTKLEDSLPRSRIATSQRGVRLIVVMKGWGCFIFHNLRVPCRPTPCNPSWHLTAPLRNKLSVLAIAPCPGLSLSR